MSREWQDDGARTVPAAVHQQADGRALESHGAASGAMKDRRAVGVAIGVVGTVVQGVAQQLVWSTSGPKGPMGSLYCTLYSMGCFRPSVFSAYNR